MRNARYRHPRQLFAATWMALFLLILGSCDGLHVSTLHSNGALATAAPIATEIGRQIFASGGNAFDVAVATAFVLAVVHPQAGNIGGGGFAVIRDGASGLVQSLDFRETAPLGATTTMYLDDSSNVIAGLSTLGAKAAGVPGTVAGMYELWSKYGSMPWEELVRPAAALADTGFVVDEYLARSIREYFDELNKFTETAEIFCPGGRTPGAGDKLVQADLARTLYAIAAGGHDGFYAGPVAEAVEACMQAHGGLITRDDLAAYRPVWRTPIEFQFDSLRIYSAPPPSSGGIAIGQILKILEPFDFSIWTPQSPEYIQTYCEAAKLAFADRSEYLGDPGYLEVPWETLLGDTYLDDRRRQIKPAHAASPGEFKPGLRPGQESTQTTHFSVCDKDGNMVALTYTLNTSYGSKLVVKGGGFLLNNEMDDFSIKPGFPNTYGLIGGEANKIEPGKRMLSSMAPTLVLKDNQPYLILGAPGGSKIITVVSQAILNFTRFRLSLAETAAQPRFHHQWLPDVLSLEQGGFDIRVRQELIRYGYFVEEIAPYSDLQILHISSDGSMAGASDPRQRGVTAGY